MDATPSSSTSGSESELDAAGLARLSSDSSARLCVIDCRPEGTSIRGATRVRLPHVLLRRIQSGSMPITNVCPLLAEPGVTVIVIPEVSGDNQMSRTIREALRNNGYSIYLFTDDAEEACSAYPSLVATSDGAGANCRQSNTGGLTLLPSMQSSSASSTPDPASMTKSPEDDVSWLNLKSLRIEPESQKPTERRRQIFPVEINSHLYLGNKETAANLPFLKQIGITHVVNVTKNLENFHEDDNSIRYLRIPVDDNSSFNLSAFFPDAITFIESAAMSGGKVLVHCLAGISRSVTVCIAYLMSSHRWSLEHAYDQVLHCNGSIAPNFHFMGQLSEFERQLGLSGQVSARVPTSAIPPPLSPSCGIEAASRQSAFFPPSSPSYKD